MLLNQAKFGDDSSAKPQSEIAIIINIGGRYSLSDRRNSSGERRVFACRAVNVSPRSIALACPVYGKVGDRVMAQIDHLGKLEGVITRVLAQGFVMAITASDQDRERLAAKIKWLESYKNHDTHDRRGDERIAPANPMSKLIHADGKVETCLVIDISVSGAAVSSESVPDVGTVLAVGSVVGKVVRHFVGGFAVQFVERQSPYSVERMVILGG
jgi:hypothetical protein